MFGEVKMKEMNNMACFPKIYRTFITNILVVMNDYESI